jgi:hypothetical protein
LQHGKYSEGTIASMKLWKRMTRQAFGSLLMVLVLLAALAYPASRFGVFEWPREYDPFVVPDLRAKPGFLTSWQMKLVDAEPRNCIAAFAIAGSPMTLKPTQGAGTSCKVSGAVTLGRLSTARLNPEDTRCAIAARLYMWERHLMQPAAQRILGEPITEILHFGSYSCRTIRGRSSMSEHATANAFDISGFRTASGKLITVKDDWRKATKEGKFLRIAHDGLCDWFNLTLSPDYNADHADHFHVDMGWWRSCR